MSLNKVVLLALLLFVYSCNKNLTEEERKELWSKAQTTGEIINRSGTAISSTGDKKGALRDAETRLSTGGGLFGKEGFQIMGDKKSSEGSNGFTSVGMPINPYLWSASLETLSFIPLSSADPFGGTIFTDWYSSEVNENERCKINVFISGAELRTQNLRVSSFCEIFKNNKWVGVKTNTQDNIDLENAILNKAKKLKLKNI
ncbi:DUF3576 domain-containing protein [Pelagibacterales bacterium SAG-MED31]|nr:DUF3576 domain-containing protein [Pelagibacterales bacterium SAG-MED31]